LDATIVRAAVEDEAPLRVLQLAHPFRDDDCGEEVAEKIGDRTDLGHEALDPPTEGHIFNRRR
jgi:hypothetical protein